MRNPFRNKTMRLAYENCIKMYEVKHTTLFYRDGSRCTGNGIASMFWRGYDGTKIGANFIDRASKETLMYAYYCAGQDIKKEEMK